MSIFGISKETTHGGRVKKMRKLLKLSQQELADVLSITQSTCSLIENNQCELKLSDVAILKEKYNVSPDWLATGQKPIFLLDKEKHTTYAKEVGERIKSARRKSLQLAVDFSVGLNADIEEIEKGEYLADPYTLLKIAYFISSDNPYQTLVYILTGERSELELLSIDTESGQKLMEQYASVKKGLGVPAGEEDYALLSNLFNAKQKWTTEQSAAEPITPE